jgi:hypothetical protein
MGVDWGKVAEEFLSKEVVAAFVGAAAAFLLVVVTDWRRHRIKAFSVLPSRIKSVHFFATQLMQAMDQNLAQKVEVMDIMTDWMRPPSLGLQELVVEVDDILDVVERAGASAVLFLLSTLDRHLRATEQIGVAFLASYPLDIILPIEGMNERRRYRRALEEARSTVERLVNICGQYPKRRRPWALKRPIERLREWFNAPRRQDSDLP